MNFAKKSLLFFLFFVLFALNSYLIGNAYVNYTVSQKQQKILAEISGLRNNTQKTSLSSGPMVLGVMNNEIELGDARAANLRNFFGKYRSPLYDYADHIVTISDKYGFDYRLLPAIGMQESNLCKYAPEDSYNCWGHGIYGRRVTKFASFEEAIDAVARNLKENYLDKGYTTPETIMSKYTPRSNGSWARSINLLITALE